MSMEPYSKFILEGLLEDVRNISNAYPGFYDTFKFTTTGNTLTRPITLGFITSILAKAPKVKYVGVDVRMGDFQPDVVAYDEKLNPLVCVDYESPNSSDSRIVKKDIIRHRNSGHKNLPYVVITTLPNKASSKWKFLYRYRNSGTSDFNENANVPGDLADIQKNPYKFWYAYYTSELSNTELSNVTLLNISGGEIFHHEW